LENDPVALPQRSKYQNMNLIKQYFTLEGRIYRSNQQLETFLNKNLKAELRTQFCTHFHLLTENAQWEALNACCECYLKQFEETDKSFIRSKLSVLSWSDLIQQLPTETALALCTYLDYHEWVLDLYAQKAQTAFLFAYLQTKNVLNSEMIAAAIQKWEKYQGVLMNHQDFAQYLK
jgi:predicted nucleotidyltransferase